LKGGLFGWKTEAQGTLTASSQWDQRSYGREVISVRDEPWTYHPAELELSSDTVRLAADLPAGSERPTFLPQSCPKCSSSRLRLTFGPYSRTKATWRVWCYECDWVRQIEMRRTAALETPAKGR
jgi:hypothetical protein